MKNVNDEKKCLASLAVFRELYDSNKDIYTIIGEFLKEIIFSQGKKQFSSTEITQLLNDIYDFEIPEAIIVTSLKKFKQSYTLQHGFYTIEDLTSFQNLAQISSKFNEAQKVHNSIIDNLFNFIENEQQDKLEKTEKDKIISSFSSFLIDETTSQEYSESISAYILKNKQDINFTKELNTIREGVILYTGLKYNSKLNELGIWDTELTIFLETEILFHFAGYNGLLYQTLFNDFFSLVKEINTDSLRKTGKRLIKLKYFEDVKKEIDGFFNVAERIVGGQQHPNPAKTAMTAIINGCNTPSDVIAKKTQFYTLLSDNQITKDDYLHYYSEGNYKYNIGNLNLLEQIAKDIETENISDCLKCLNFINIHRKGISNKGFENTKCILLTGTSKTLAVAWHPLIKENGNIPLASDLYFITNKFWFKLNKGFGTSNDPKSFDIITKAQIVLSTQLNNTVSEKYDELQLEFKNGTLSESQAISTIAELRKQAKTPENIDDTNVNDILKSIKEKSIEDFLKEQEAFKIKASKTEQESIQKDGVIKQKEEVIIQKEDELKKKDDTIKDQNEELEKYRKVEREKQEKKMKQRRIFKKACPIAVCLLILALGIFLYLKYTQIWGIVTVVISIISFLIAIYNFNKSRKKKN